MIYLYQNLIRFTTAEKLWLYMTKIITSIYLSMLTSCVLQGASVHNRDFCGWQPLHEACNFGHTGWLLSAYSAFHTPDVEISSRIQNIEPFTEK